MLIVAANEEQLVLKESHRVFIGLCSFSMEDVLFQEDVLKWRTRALRTRCTGCAAQQVCWGRDALNALNSPLALNAGIRQP